MYFVWHRDLLDALFDLRFISQVPQIDVYDVLDHMRWMEINPALLRVPVIRDKRGLANDVFVGPGHQVKICTSLWLVVSI
jgi:hypothetical protein